VTKRLKPIFGALAALTVTLTGSACASHAGAPAAQPALKLERVVFLMRHGTRAPTGDPALPVNYADQPWPKWSVDYGLLTPRGMAGIRLLAASDRAYYRAQGLLPATGCPVNGGISAKASWKDRAIKTGEAYLAVFAPGCTVKIDHPDTKETDALFHPLDGNPASFDGHRAYQEALALAPPGGLAAEAKADADLIGLLQKTLGCCGPKVCADNHLKAGCSLADIPTTLDEKKHDGPSLEGPLGIGSTLSQNFLLEYLDGMPMDQVGWGRLSRDQIETLLRFHPIKFRYEAGSPYVARATAGPLARIIVDALNAPAGSAPFTTLFGHDTNIADLGSLLGLDWQVTSYPKDDVPPGAALGFELYRDDGGHQFVRAFIRAQTMDQLRNQTPLTGSAQPYRTYLSIPGCDQKEAAAPCPLDRFTAIVTDKLATNAS
jgi:4-phytase/acid phosphatase